MGTGVRGNVALPIGLFSGLNHLRTNTFKNLSQTCNDWILKPLLQNLNDLSVVPMLQLGGCVKSAPQGCAK